MIGGNIEDRLRDESLRNAIGDLGEQAADLIEHLWWRVTSLEAATQTPPQGPDVDEMIVMLQSRARTYGDGPVGRIMLAAANWIERVATLLEQKESD